jgi:hypothetical protein
MAPPPDRIFAKTAQGRAALLARGDAVRGRLRALLILVNGERSVSALQSALGDDAAEGVEALLARGLVEAVTAAPAAGEPPPDPRLAQRKREVLARLEPHFGPEVGVAAQPVVVAGGVDEFNQALQLMERKIALYLGRKEAARTLAGLRIE